MKKIILAAVTIAAAAASINAQAATAAVCSGGAGSSQTVTSIASAATSFVKTGFTPKCSNNVILQYEDFTTYMKVGGASVKGKNAFAGSSMGGAVSVSASCQATGCTLTDVTTAVGSAASS
jgi:hypothetical protein